MAERKREAPKSPPGEPDPALRPPLASFEQGIGRLEEIVGQLETGELTLEESLRLFQEGTLLSRDLNRTLDRAERSIEQLESDPTGAQKIVPFEPETES